MTKTNPRDWAGSSPYRPDTIRQLIQDALLSAGLGQENPHAPLADIIQPGMSVLLKPNWVLHRNESGGSMDCMVTHPAFIETALDEVLLARPGRVLIGDAPIQLCQFNLLVTAAWRESVRQRTKVPVEIIDFRRQVARSENLADGVDGEVRPLDRYVLFDLAKESLLDPVSRPAGKFRVTNYHPGALTQAHAPGRHRYVICREAFEADVILNLPKLKTHRKTGITGALKNLVGLNGDKDCLPHHRVGGTVLGGDCYPGLAPLKRLAEFCMDRANRRLNTPGYVPWSHRARAVQAWQHRFGDIDMEGGWHGNDTTWRMVLDLNRILLYGRSDGSLSDTPLRQIYSLTDGIIAGQGEGPLAPEPLDLGVVTFAASSALAEVVHAGLLGLEYRKVPLLREAFAKYRYPLTNYGPEECVVKAAGEQMTWEETAERFGVCAKLPRGWIGHVERLRSETANA